MQKFQRNTLEVEAVQWFPGIAVEGLVEVKPEIVVSSTRNHYYLSTHPQGLKRPDAWFPVNAEDKGKAPPVGIMPFMFWKVKEGHRLPAKEGDDLVERYLAYMGWNRLPEPIGRIRISGETKIVVAGKWIVIGPGGQVLVLDDREFTECYTPKQGGSDAGVSN